MWSHYRVIHEIQALLPGEFMQVVIPAGEIVEYRPKPDSANTIAVLWRDRPLMVSESDLRQHARYEKTA